MGIKVDLGAGPIPFRKRPGFDFWKDSVTVDVCQYGDIDIVTDISESIPLESNSVSSINCVEVIEHISYPRVDGMVSEVYRILEPGGSILVQCPNFATCAASFLKAGLSPEEFRYVYLCIVGQQTSESDTHRNIFTPESLVALWQKKPFRKVELIPMGDVPYPQPSWNGKYHIQVRATK